MIKLDILPSVFAMGAILRIVDRTVHIDKVT